MVRVLERPCTVALHSRMAGLLAPDPQQLGKQVHISRTSHVQETGGFGG